MEMKNYEEMAIGVAKQAGVSVEDARKVLNSLGLEGLAANVGSAGLDIGKVSLGDLKLAVRFGKGGLMV
jgi:hypothetical protein